ncbi:hypothetical protein [Coraliomargarita parva]|uniref:hypothetical protein n=1 Tax=Coraliomargarita parva TaxID=3014050 RepID=UPI0022B38EB7|nr:hypothetical protein [Coraliomargarita parva]
MKLAQRRGSTLVLVVIFTSVLSVVAASLLSYGMSERRMNKSNILFTEARNASESMVEYGFSELKMRWLRQTSFSMNELRANPLIIPYTAEAFLGTGRVDCEALELVGGMVPPGAWAYIDPSDPANTNDPQKGKLVFSRDVQVYAKSLVTDPVLGERVAYCSQTLSVRDAPLFSHAIFYNMDLEFHPGPQMEIQGPVHANGDIYLQASDSLLFYSTIMSAGDIFYGPKTSTVGYQGGTVSVLNSDGDWVSFYSGSGGKTNPSSYYDSNMGEDWRAFSTDRWDGNVGSEAHGVPSLNPIGIDSYIPDDPETAADEKYNPGYALIEPVVAEDHANYKGDAVREQQFAYKAGMILKVTNQGSGYAVNAYKYKRSSSTDPTSAPILVDGEPELEEIDLTAVESGIGSPLVQITEYSEDDYGNPVGGFYDRRQQQALDVIEVDIAVLSEAVASSSQGTDVFGGTYDLDVSSAVDWNGIVYVELPYDDSTTSRADKVMPAVQNMAVRLVNGSEVPTASFAGSSGYDTGFTLATNGQLYVQGHFNSDGDASTGSSTATDDGLTYGSDEQPVALFADSITILSSNFDDSKSKQSPSARKASYNEVSAALVTGLLPSIPGTSVQSGGAHNLPRFLEDWSGVEFRYRGSLVALYESEAGTSPMTSGYGAWYSPPKRNWGYSELFGAGMYPPGTPNTRDFRRRDFRFLNEAEYAAELASLDGFDGSSEALGHGESTCGSGEDEDGKNNNGHGNNEDGVDSSNPGNSKTGEDSDPDVDDEI